MSIIIGIDHGYYAIKTAHCSFPAGLTSYGEHEPYTRQGLLEFGGCFFVCGTGRQPIQRDKTANDNYYLLTLAAIAKEIRQRGLPPECSVRIAAGLPLTSFGRDKPKFREYLLRSNQPVNYKFEDVEYSITIEEVAIFPQGYAALMTEVGLLQDEPSMLLMDLGGWTVDLMRIDNAIPVADTAHSLELGMIRCVDDIREQVRRETGLSLTDAQIENMLAGHPCTVSDVRRARCRQVGAYLHWLYDHKYTDLDYSLQLPNFKRTAPQIPQVWSPEEIDKILAVIDTANPVGRRNYAIFLLLARTGLRISDVLGLKFSNINWKQNCISLSQQKTGNALSLPLSKELGMAIISYLQDGRPQSSSAFIFLSHNAPFQPLGEHNNFNPEFHKYLRRAGIAIPTKRHTGVHTIRHSFATNMLRKGTPVQDVSQILGHSNISVTETYLRVDIEHMRLCSLSLEGLL